MNYVDTYHLAAHMPDGFILTCYGIKDEPTAQLIAKRILVSGLASKVELTHTTKATSRARWVNEKTTITM